ncbi:MAG: MASE3 domain-containing protein, partial [SAR324 cluster bacterium]|nr:MASE3 domain-containing protein [SAR324 cluster bacterium]
QSISYAGLSNVVPISLNINSKPLVTQSEVLFTVSLFVFLVFLNHYNYVLFHTIAELISIFIAAGIFLIAINTRRFTQNDYLYFLGLSYFFIGLVDLLHAITLPGVGIFPQAISPNITVQFWILARYIEALSLLVAPIFIFRKVPAKSTNLAYFFVGGFFIWMILFTSLFPDCHLGAEGLTPFKKISELVISGILIGSVFVLKKQSHWFDITVFKLILIAVFCTVASELALTLYVELHSLPNVAGHFLKVLSFLVVYKAIINTSLAKPFDSLFRDLSLKDKELRSLNESLENRVAKRTLELKIAKEAAEASRADNESIMENLPNVFYRTDLNGIITIITPACQKEIGFAPEEMIGRPMSDFYDNPSEREKVVQAIKDGNGRATNVKAAMKNDWGETIWVETQALIRKNEKGNPWCIEGIARNITQEIIAQKTLEEAKAEAEKANLAKSNFLNMMSHELRTPMNGVLGMAQLLLQTELTQEQKNFSEVIITSGKSLTRILSDILDLAKIEAGKQTLQRTPFVLFEILETVNQLFQGVAKLNNIDLHLSLDPKISELLSGDEELLSRAISNLVGNAVKFTKSGSVTIEAKLESQNSESQTIQFTVKDTGIGIPEDLLTHIFEPFHQVEELDRREFGGTGLGLSIVKQIATLMGGGVEVQSQVGQGSQFILTLPFVSEGHLKKFDAQSGEENENPLHLTPTLGLKALLVEDDKINQEVVKRMLKNLGFEVAIANHGGEAVSKSTLEKYDLIFMDILMPIMTGYEATECIRHSKSNPNQATPIIAITAMARVADYDHCMQGGMDDYITKPVEFTTLQKSIAKFA